MADLEARERKVDTVEALALIFFFLALPFLFPYWANRKGLLSRENTTLVYGIGAMLIMVAAAFSSSNVF